jgi:hypothetical protein
MNEWKQTTHAHNVEALTEEGAARVFSRETYTLRNLLVTEICQVHLGKLADRSGLILLTTIQVVARSLP